MGFKREKATELWNAFYDWRSKPAREREPKHLVGWGRLHGVGRSVMTRLNQKYEAMETAGVNKKKVKLEEIPDYLKKMNPEIIKAMVAEAINGSHKAAELLMKYQGMLVEKSDSKVTVFDGDNIIRAMLAARRTIEDDNRGVDALQGESPVLLEDVRSDSGQGADEGNPLAALGTPEDSSKDAARKKTDSSL